jgi:tetratricopeptide (TPR) repeat protein
MATSPLLLSTARTSTWRLLRTPLIVLAILVASFFLEFRWVQSSTGGKPLLFHQTSSGWQQLPSPKGYPESVRVSKSGTAWVLTWGRSGLNRWDGTQWRSYTSTDFGTRASFLDREFTLDGENLWVATEQGMLHWDGQKWQNDPQVTAGTGAWTVAGGGEVWVVDSTGKQSHFAKGQWNSQQVSLPGVTWSKRAYGPPTRLARTEDGSVWLMRQGLWRWDGTNWIRITAGEESLQDAELLGAAGNRIWLSDASGLRSMSSDGKRWTVYTNKLIGLDEDGSVNETVSAGDRTWFATSNGVIEFDGSKWSKLAIPGDGIENIHRVAAGAEGSLWIIGTHRAISVQATRSLRYVIYLQALTPLAILGVIGWIIKRFRKRQLQQHQRVTQAVQHATGEVPEELEAGAGLLKSRGIMGTAFLWIATIVSYVVLRLVWPKAPYWMIPLIGISIHLLMTFQASLVKRKPKPSDPIGPGAPSRYNWAKSWKAVAGSGAVIVLVNLDRFPSLHFLRGYWLWIFIFVPAVYHTVAVNFLNRAAKRGEYDRALNIIRWAYFYNPSGIEPLRMSGHMLLMAGRYREAEDTLRRSLASSHASKSYAYALEYLGDALMEQGRYDEAMRSYEAAIHAFPALRRPYRGMTETLLRRGANMEQALECVEKILDYSDISWAEKKGNGNARDDYWGLKAWALGLAGRTSEVAAAIEQALSHTNKLAAPDMASTHYRAGMAMQAMGNDSAAKEHFKLAMQFDPHGRRGLLAQAAMRETHVWGTVRV